jgi:mono/diheme cytochrome c family protein
LDVAAVDEHGNKVDEALGVTGPFTLDLPWGHDYILVFADVDGLLGAMVYGDREQTRFSVDPGVLALDLGQITINTKKRLVKLKNPDRVKPGHGGRGDEDEDGGTPPGVTGDPVAGAELWAGVCAGCHGGGLEEGSAREIAEVLRKGEGRAMPAFPDLVASAADIAAYLAGGGLADTDGDGIPDATDQCPTVSGDGADGCPLPAPAADADGDGVPDAVDACPNVAAATPDGCPLPTPAADTDGDGVPDAVDACPTVAGAGPDGCPVPSPAPQPARPAALQSTCLSCHGDRSALVACTNAKWMGHRGTKVTSAVFDEVSTWATGGVCP